MALDLSFIRKTTGAGRKTAIRTYLSAVLEKKSIPQVRAERKAAKTAPVTGLSGNIIHNEPRLTVQKRGGGWVRATYRDPYAGKEVTFNLRSNIYRQAIGQKQNRWYDAPSAVYSAWINETRAGALYTARRQVEGMLKVAEMKGDIEMAGKLTQVLGMDDEKVAQFRDEWERVHTDSEIEEFYEYEEDFTGPTYW